MKPSKPKAVWVVKESGKFCTDGFYNFYIQKKRPEPDKDGAWRRYDDYIDGDSFEKIFNLKLKCGQCLKVEFKGRVIR